MQQGPLVWEMQELKEVPTTLDGHLLQKKRQQSLLLWEVREQVRRSLVKRRGCVHVRHVNIITCYNNLITQKAQEPGL
jgi:hypothetical protein